MHAILFQPTLLETALKRIDIARVRTALANLLAAYFVRSIKSLEYCVNAMFAHASLADTLDGRAHTIDTIMLLLDTLGVTVERRLEVRLRTYHCSRSVKCSR